MEHGLPGHGLQRSQHTAQWLCLADCSAQAQGLQPLGSRVRAQQCWRMGLVAPWHLYLLDQVSNCVACTGRQILIHCNTREVHMFL